MGKKLEKLPKRISIEEISDFASRFNIFESTVKEKWEVHWHEFYEMELVLEGKGTHIMNGKPSSYQRGSFFLLTPADFHEFIPVEGSILHYIHVKFDERMLSEEVCEMILQSTTLIEMVLKETELPAIEADFRRLLWEFNHEAVGRQRILQGSLERIIIDMVRKVSGRKEILEQSCTSLGMEGIHRSILYIQGHFREPITLKTAADQANLTSSYFSKCFHKVTGLSFKNYLQEVRLKFAISLLSSSQLPVTEICYASGYNTLSHFLRAFKHRYGCSPNQFRKKV